MVCKTCSAENPAGKNFCGTCGAKLEAPVAAVPVVGEDGAFYCARHKKVVTRLRCGRCETPICPKCSVYSPAGVRCPDCARNRVALRPMGVLNSATRNVEYSVQSIMSRYGIFGVIVLFGLVRFLYSGFARQSAVPTVPTDESGWAQAVPPKITPLTDQNSPPLKPLDWKRFLTDFRNEYLAVESAQKPPPDWLAQNSTRDIIAPGASEARIVATEQNLGLKLPPSYRAFLKASNGLRHFDVEGYSGNLLPVEKLAPIMEAHPDFVQDWGQTDTQITPAQHLADRTAGSAYRGEYLYNAIQISDYSDAGVLVLCPDVRTTQGEWECWHIGNWLPGAERYPSFQEYMVHIAQQNHARYLKLKSKHASDSSSP